MERFPHVEWIWWLDLDALIMTPSLELYDYLLGPEAMGGKLLNKTTIKMNDRIKVDNKALPTLFTGQVTSPKPLHLSPLQVSN